MFLPHRVTRTSLPYSELVGTKEERKARTVALHPGLSGTACYDNKCPVHLDAKQRADWSPKKLGKKEKNPARDMDWGISYDADPRSEWGSPPPAKQLRHHYKDLVKWQHCARDNCSVHRQEKVDTEY